MTSRIVQVFKPDNAKSGLSAYPCIAVWQILHKRDDGTEGPMTIYDPQTQIFRPEAFDGKAWRKHFLKKRRTFGERFSRASVITFNVHRDQLHVINYSPASRRSVSHIRHDDERALNLSAISHVDEHHPSYGTPATMTSPTNANTVLFRDPSSQGTDKLATSVELGHGNDGPVPALFPH